MTLTNFHKAFTGQLIFFLFLLLVLAFLASPVSADIGAGVHVALLQKEIVGSTQGTIDFEVSNINPAGSARISEVKLSLPADFEQQGNTTYSGLNIQTGEARQFSFDLKTPNLNENRDYILEFAVSFDDGSLSKRKETLTVLADRVPPISTLTNLKNSSYFNSKPIPLEFNTIDPSPSSGVSIVEVNINNGVFQLAGGSGDTFKFDFNPDSDGKYVITYRAVDKSNNSETPKQVEIIYDTTPPQATILNLQSLINNPTPQISFKFSDQFATYSNCEVSVSDYKEKVLATADSLSSLTLPKLADGTYTAVVSCPDFAGNDGKSEPVQFTIDTRPPTIINITPSNGTLISENQTLIIQFDKQISIEDFRKSLLLLEGDRALNLDISTEDNKTFTIKTPPNLEDGKKYSLVLDKSVRDAAGNNLDKNYSFEYRTEPSPFSGFAVFRRAPTTVGAFVGLAFVLVLVIIYYRNKIKRHPLRF